MTNWPKVLRDFLVLQGKSGNWSVTSPAWTKVYWPYRVSRDYLRDPARSGQCLIWCTSSRATVTAQTERVVTGVLTVDVNCYCRARSDNERHVDEAQQQSLAMRDEVMRLIKLNDQNISPAWITRIGSGEREMLDTTIVPCAFIQLVPVDFHHGET